jgi:hypothetical protein
MTLLTEAMVSTFAKLCEELEADSLRQRTAPMPRKLSPRAQLSKRYGVTDETIRRWRLDPAKAFPKPATVISNREYFDDDELKAWEATQQQTTIA